MHRSKIFIADDHSVVIDGISSALSSLPTFEVIGSAKSAGGLYEKLESGPLPELLILDYKLKDAKPQALTGSEVTSHLKQVYPNLKVLIVTMHDKYEIIQECLDAGADGYILKNSGINVIVEAIERILSDHIYLGPETQNVYLQGTRNYRPKDQPAKVHLTRREHQVLALICDGHTNDEIARMLAIASTTAATHRKNVMIKAEVSKQTPLVKWAVKNGFDELPENF